MNLSAKINENGTMQVSFKPDPIIYFWKNVVDNVPFYHNIFTGKQGHNLADVVDESLEYKIINIDNKCMCDIVTHASICEVDGEQYVHLMMGSLNFTCCSEGEVRSIRGRNIIMINARKHIYFEHVYLNDYTTEYSLTRVDAIDAYMPLLKRIVPFKSTQVSDMSITEAFKKVVKVGYMAGNRTTTFDYGQDVINWIKYKEPQRSNSKQQQAIDALLSCPLKEHNSNSDGRTAFIDSLTDNGIKHAVIRTYQCGVECARLYVSHKKITACKRLHNGDYIPFPQWKRSSGHWRFGLPVFNHEDLEGTPLEYYSSIITMLPEENLGLALWILLSTPIMESIAKHSNIGMDFFREFIQHLMKTDESPTDALDAFWGCIDMNKKKLPQKFGLSPKQFAQSLKFGVSYFHSPYAWGDVPNLQRPIDLKNIAGISDLSSIDEDTYEKFLDFLITIKKNHAVYLDSFFEWATEVNCFIAVRKVWGFKTALNSIPYILKLAATSLEYNIYNGNCTLVKTYMDFCNMVGQLNLQNRFKPYKFNTPEEMLDIHDTLVGFINHSQIHASFENWEKRKKVWEKWIYKEDEDDSFTVVFPELPDDIVVEGVELHHCVKSYIPRISKGATNVLFIRKKSDPLQPFFTVEISNEGVIEQIHGSCNCNISTNPEVEAFVIKWAKEKNLKFNNYNKIR